MTPYEMGVTPQCATIDIMEANINNIHVQSLPCDFGTCDLHSKCKAYAQMIWEDHRMYYGAGPDYVINSLETFSVKTEFMRKDDGLLKVMTTLTQGESVLTLE